VLSIARSFAYSNKHNTAGTINIRESCSYNYKPTQEQATLQLQTNTRTSNFTTTNLYKNKQLCLSLVGHFKRNKDEIKTLHRYQHQSWAFATFTPIRYSLFRYFNTSFRYRYSATFPKIAISYSLFAIATFVSSVLRTASILGLYLQ
jgi:hypothetical protein